MSIVSFPSRPGSLSRRTVLASAAAAGIGLSIGGLATPPLASAAAFPPPSPIGGRKNQLAFVLSHEQFPTQQLLEFGTAAERAGFDGFWTSDHIQPWQENQGHSMFPWITLALLRRADAARVLWHWRDHADLSLRSRRGRPGICVAGGALPRSGVPGRRHGRSR